MASHTYHAEDLHDTGLQDGCPRCEEHAEEPWATLDNRMLGALIQRVEQGLEPRSNAERRAMGSLEIRLRKAGVIN